MAETYFVMWRLTHDIKYREAAWEMAQAIRTHCRTTGGFSSIKRVDQSPTVKINIQPPHFLSGTLKFLYLTFADDATYPLDEWVFNSAGHMFPGRGPAAATATAN